VVNASDIWPINPIGLKSAVIVAGGSETEDGDREEGADGDENSVVSDGRVAVVSGEGYEWNTRRHCRVLVGLETISQGV
jgi:hypothetical protein